MGCCFAWAWAGFCGAFSAPAVLFSVGIALFFSVAGLMDAVPLKRGLWSLKSLSCASALLFIVPIVIMTHAGWMVEVDYRLRTSWGAFETTYADAVTSRGLFLAALLSRILYHSFRNPGHLGE